MNFKINDRILKGNVSILVILVLLACSLMGILSMNFLNNLIAYTDDTYSYYKTYYLSKAGLELALTEINNAGVGFSQNINSGDLININNLCEDCYFNLDVRGRSSLISNYFWKDSICTGENMIELGAGKSMTIPFFYDSTSGVSQALDGTENIVFLYNKNGTLKIFSDDTNSKLDVGLVIQSGNDMSLDYLYFSEISIIDGFSSYFDNLATRYEGLEYKKSKMYFIISNPNEYPVNFCIGNVLTDNKSAQWPTTKYFISSRGEYRGRTVGLQAVYAQPIPSFFINPYISFTNYGSEIFSLEY